jgi:hypothetical protein
MAALAAVLCTLIVCGSALAAWVLWLRSRPACTRAEYEALSKEVGLLRSRVMGDALSRRGA